jgi:protein phosphatase
MRALAKGLTDVGRKRDHNEDSFLIDEELSLYAVADGMGGHAGGGTASRMAIEILQAEVRKNKAALRKPAPLSESPVPEILRQAMETACRSIFDRAQSDPRLTGMGTTTVALLIARGVAYFAHVGDSRAYLVRKDLVQQLTEDHSLVNEQLKAGMISPEEARCSRFKNVITRSVGFEQQVAVDLMGLVCEPGDTLVLCSDGMSNLVEEQEILQICQLSSVEEIAKTLVDLSNERGGDDNITVVCVHLCPLTES